MKVNLLKEWQDRFPYFSPKEVLSPQGLYLFNFQIIKIDFPAMNKLCELREKVGPLICNSEKFNLKLRGYRSHEENLSIKGSAKYSFHIQGKAFDIHSNALSPHELAEEALVLGFSGVVIYSNRIHCDIRPRFSGFYLEDKTK